MAVKQNNDENKKQINPSPNNNVSQIPKDRSTEQYSDENINYSSATHNSSSSLTSKRNNDSGEEHKTIEKNDIELQHKEQLEETVKTKTVNNLKSIKDVLLVICETNDTKQFNISLFMLQQLSIIKYPKHAEEIKSFKENIQLIMQIFEKISEENPEYYIYYLRQVFTLICTSEPSPSCAIAIIFQLIPDDKITYALQRAFQTFGDPHDDESIKETVKTLCDWLRICTFCTNLHIWILSIINGVYDKHKYSLLYEICNENIEKLFISLIIPHCRTKVFAIIHEILTFIKDNPTIFHKIVRRVPSVIRQLRKECEENKNNTSKDVVNTKRVLANLIDLMLNLVMWYPVENDMYSELEIILDECSGPYFRLFLNTTQDAELVRNEKVGLINLGNTCYMNSVLQVLGLTKEFVHHILLSNCKTPLFSNLRNLLAQMYYSNRVVLAPADVFVTARPAYFTIGVQQDSSELLLYLLESLHDQEDQFNKLLIDESNANKLKQLHSVQDLSGFNNIEQNINHSEFVNLKFPATPSRTQELAEEQECNIKSIVEKTFTGKLLVNLKCLVCNTVSTNNDSLRCFQLSHPENEMKHSAQELLDHYCSTEKLEGDNQYYCEQCKCYNNAEILKTVSCAPKNAILVFKQFTYDKITHVKGKLMHKIYHNENITIQEHKGDAVFAIKYSLYAGIIHAGYSVESGHYYAFGTDLTRDSDNKLNWYKYNDQIVTKFDFDEINNLHKTNTPYILFYRQIDNDIENMPNLNGIPIFLQQFIEQDNNKFYDELRHADFQRLNNFYNDHNLRKYSDNDDTEPPPTGGCGENALNINVNNFIC